MTWKEQKWSKRSQILKFGWLLKLPKSQPVLFGAFWVPGGLGKAFVLNTLVLTRYYKHLLTWLVLTKHLNTQNTGLDKAFEFSMHWSWQSIKNTLHTVLEKAYKFWMHWSWHPILILNTLVLIKHLNNKHTGLDKAFQYSTQWTWQSI